MTTMQPELKQQLDDTIEQFLAREYDFDTRQKIVGSSEGYSQANWQAFSELGWLGIPFEEQYGGIGGTVVDTAQMMSLFGRHLVVEPVLSTLGLVGAAVAAGTNQALKEAILPRLVQGECIGALALEESGSRGNPRCIGVTATPTSADGGFQLRGEKIAVLNAPQADCLLVCARTGGGQLELEGISLFLLDCEQPGIEMLPYTTVDGHRAANIRFDLQVPADRLVAAPGQGGALLQRVVNNGLLMLCAEATGIMKALLDTTVEYTNTRKQFGVPLASFQVLRHRMVDMFIDYERSSALLDSVVAGYADDGSGDQRSMHLLKAQVGQAGRAIGDAAIQLHGGMGMTDELAVGHYVKRLVAIGQLLGGTDLHLRQAWHCQG